MQVAEINELKSNIQSRIKLLENELNLTPENNRVIQLDNFRSTSGWEQFFYYLFNRSRIRAATEYFALKEIEKSASSLLADDLQKDQIELFNEEAKDLQPSGGLANKLDSLTATLQKFLQNDENTAAQKTKARNNFWTNLANQSVHSETIGDRVLGHYITSRKDLVPPIVLSSFTEGPAEPPAHLLLLEDAGNRHDIEKAYRAHKGEQTPSPQTGGPTEHLLPKPFPEAKLSFFKKQYSFTYMESIQVQVETMKNSVEQAHQALNIAKQATTKMCANFVQALIDLIKEWRSPKTTPTSEPAALSAPAPTATAASYFPLFGAPQATTAPPANPASESVFNNWVPSFLKW